MASDELKEIDKFEVYKDIQMNRIFRFFGHTHSEGNVKGDHFGRILTYLIINKEENYNTTVAKLRLVLLIQKRYLKEYLDSFEAWKIIEVSHTGNNKTWKWRGLSESEVAKMTI